MNDRDTITGLRIFVGNAALQIQSLLDGMQIGAPDLQERAKTTAKACQFAADALVEAQPVLRKLARKPRGT